MNDGLTPPPPASLLFDRRRSWQVVIKYVPYVGDSKRALDEYTSEIFMGGKNTIAMHNTCEDSLLASPLIFDLVIMAELCERIQVRRVRRSRTCPCPSRSETFMSQPFLLIMVAMLTRVLHSHLGSVTGVSSCANLPITNLWTVIRASTRLALQEAKARA